MARSFLNLITTDGRLCRLAEFGFLADAPSFYENGIVFRAADKYKRFDLDTGAITAVDAPLAKKSGAQISSPDGRYTVTLKFDSEITNGRGYVHMMLHDNEKNTETVLTRFMGSENSMGAMPFSEDSQNIVFFGYPEDELG